MSAPAMIRSQYGNLFGSNQLPVLEELIWMGYNMHPSKRDLLFKKVSTDRDLYQSSEIHDLELFSEVPEGSEYNFKRPKQGAAKTLTVVKYGLGFSISEEWIDDAKYEPMKQLAEKLGRSAKEAQEVSAMNIFNNGFSSETTSDAVAIFSSSHTLPSGGTFRNQLSSAADLSVTSLEQALLDYEVQFVGDTGIIYNIRPKYLVVHPSNKRYANELIGSDLKADSADNNMNSFKGEGLMVCSSPHLSDTDAWFSVSEPSENHLRIVSRKPFETKAAGPDVGFSSDAVFVKGRYREIIGCLRPEGLFGTAGA